MKSYTLNESLVQAAVDVLNSFPAGQVRHLLNELEAECRRQDQERAVADQQREREVIEQQAREKMRAELQASLQPLDA